MKSTRTNSLARWLYITICAVIISTLQVQAAAPTHPPQQASQLAQAITSPVTIRTTYKLADNWDANAEGVGEVPLLQLTAEPGADKAVLLLTWVRDSSGWFSRWLLQIRSETGASVALLSNTTNDATKAQSGTLDLATVSPISGHEYETVFAYNPSSGDANLVIRDTTANEILFRGSVQTASSTSPLYLATAIAARNGATTPISVSSNLITPNYVPVGTKWALGVFDTNLYVNSTLFAPEETPYLELWAPTGTANGEYQVLLEHDGARSVSAVVKGNAGAEMRYQLPALPLGQSVVSLQYVQNGQVLWSDALPVRVGSAFASFDQFTVNRAERQVTAQLYVLGEKLPAIPVSVQATLTRMIWDTKTRKYQEESYKVSDVYQGSVVPGSQHADAVAFSFPMPSENGLYKVVLEAESSAGISFHTDTKANYIAVWDAPKPVLNKPFTIVVLPDSQIYPMYYPEIWLRQSEWIAANAVERNIPLILHMGDITNNNIPSQWEVAYTSMSLLDGLVPYVLSLGNHDFSAGAGIVRDRKATLFNDYFRPSNFPLLAGTYEEGRLDNSYHLLNLAGTDYLILSLEYAPRDAVLDWANSVVARYPQHKVIMITHTYTNTVGNHKVLTFDQPVPPGSHNDGTVMWSQLVNKYDNFLMVLSGHLGVPAIPKNVARTSKGNKVFEMLNDFQSEPNGGNGWMLLLEFRPDDTVHVQVYSPYLDAYKTDVDRYGFTNDFFIDLANGYYRRPNGTVQP